MNKIKGIAANIAAEGYAGTARRIVDAGEQRNIVGLLVIGEELDSVGLPQFGEQILMAAKGLNEEE